MQVAVVGGSDGGRGRSGEVIGVVAEVVQVDGAATGAVGRPDGQIGYRVPMGRERAGEVKIFSLPFKDGGGRRVAVAGGESGARVPRRDSNGSCGCIDGVDCSLRRVFRAAQIFFDDYFVAQIQAGCCR